MTQGTHVPEAKRPRRIVIVWMPAIAVTFAGALLAGCSEHAQTATGVRSDTPVFQGTNEISFTAAGWKPGDRNSWEQQLKVRALNGQNDYAKVN